MVEVYLIVTGLVFFAWLYALVRQTQRSTSDEHIKTLRPVVPLNLRQSDEAVLVAGERGRIVYANETAHRWFGLDGGQPDLSLMAHQVHPQDALYDLLAGAGRMSFRLGQRQVEAVSHTIPTPEGPRIVVVMREAGGERAATYTEYDPLIALAIMAEISEVTGQNPRLENTAETIVRALEPAVTFDSAEITLWEAASKTLRPLHFGAVRSATGQLIAPEEQQPQDVYRVGEGYTGWIAMYRQPLLINDVTGRTDVRPKTFKFGYQSYVGVPLLVGDEFVGTLELTHTKRNAFSQRDVALLQAISGQVAAALQVARVYTEQAARVAELDGLQQIAEVMGQLGDTHELYAQLTQRIAHLMDVDLCGVLLYDEDEHTFRSLPPFYGVPDALVRDYRLTVVPETELYNIWHHQPWWYSNDPDSPVIKAMGFDDIRSAIAINHLALSPMIVGGRRIGLLLVINKRRAGGFTEPDMRLLMAYARQAAAVVENARLYDEEQRRTRELSGLQQIAQAIGVLRNPEELYSQITARIADLMGVQMCGILLYDPREHVLVSQYPFHGMDDPERVAFYQVPSPPESAVAKLWQERDTWLSNDVLHDPATQDTALAALAPQVGIRQMVMATLRVGGTRLGVLQAANKLDGSDFTEDDARILSIFAGQAAMLIDNARLYREMQRRTHEAEGLRAVTEIASTAVPSTETIENVLIAVSNLLMSEIAVLGLVDEETGQLVFNPEYSWGAKGIETYRINPYEPGFEQSVLLSRRPFLSNDLQNDRRVLPPYKPIIEQLGLHNALMVPLVVQNRSLGEMTVANKTSGEPYTKADLDLLQALAAQVAAMLDRMRLYQATDQDLRRRVRELNALGRVSHELSQTLELDRILDVIRQEALRSTSADAASIVLLAERTEWPSPDEPQIAKRFGEGRALRRLAPVERATIERNAVLMVENYGASEFEARPKSARSALAVPIAFGEQVVGVLHLFSDKPNAFDQRTADFLMALTDQATIALGNARRYQELQTLNERLRRRAEQMGRIFELGTLFREGLSLEETLEEVALSIQETVGFNVVLISLVDEQAGVLRRTAQAGLPLAVFEELKKTNPPLEQARGLFQDRFRISNSYFLPAEGSAELTAELSTYQVLQERAGTGPQAWAPDDMLLIPLYGTGGQWLGLMSVDDPRSGRRPDKATVEALEIFASLTAFSIENYRLLERIRQEAESARRERDRLVQLHLVAESIQRAEDVPSRLQVIADGIHEAGWEHVVITLRDEHLEPTTLIQAGYSAEEAASLAGEIRSGAVWREWINDLEFHKRKLGAGYYLRYNDPWVREHALKDTPIEPPEVPADQWHPLDKLYIPLVGPQSQRIIGIIAMDSPVGGHVPTEDELRPFELFAAQAVAAVETARLYQETVRAAEQEQRLNEVMEAISAAITPHEVILALGHGLQQVVPFTRLCVARYDREQQHFELVDAHFQQDGSLHVQSLEPMKLEESAIGAVFEQGTPQLYQLTTAPERESLQDLAAWHEQGERSAYLVPMSAGGQKIGVLHLGSELENAFSFQENTELIQRLANLSAVALEKARLFDQTERRAYELDQQARRLALLNRLSTRLAQTLDVQEIYRIVLDELRGALGAFSAGLVLIESEDVGRLVQVSPAKLMPQEEMLLPLKDNESVTIVQETHRALASPDVLHDPIFEKAWDVLRKRGTQALLIVPLVVGEKVLGTIGIDFDTPHTFSDAEIELAETIAGQASLAIEKARLYNETLELTIFNQAVVESIQQGIVVLDADLNIRRVNRYMIDHYGWAQEAVGQRLFDYRPDYAEFLREPLAVVLGVGEPQVQYEVEHRDEDGTLSVRNYHVYAMREAGRVTGIVILVEDVTERVQLERDLADHVMQMATLTEVSGHITATLDPQHVIDLILDALGRVIPYDGVALWLREMDSDELTITAARGYQDTDAISAQDLLGLTVEIAYSPIFREMAAQTQVVNIGDVRADPRFPAGAESVYRNWLGAPLTREGQVVGVIALEKREPNFYTARHEQLALAFANQAAIALSNAQLFQETRERARVLDEQAQRLALLNRVALALAQTLDLENIFEIALREAALALGIEEGSAIQIDPAHNEGRVIVNYPRGDEPPNLVFDVARSPLFQRLESGLLPFVVENNEDDPFHADLRHFLRRQDVVRSLLVPLGVGGTVIGAIRLDATKPEQQFSNMQIELAQTLASQAAVAVQNASLFEQRSVRTRELETLFESAQAIAVTLDLDEVIRRVTMQMVGALHSDTCSVFLWDDVNNTLILRGEISARIAETEAETIGAVFDLSDYPLREKALRERELIVVRQDDPDVPAGEMELLKRHEAASRLLVPLVVNEISIGLVEVEVFDASYRFRAEERRLASTLASQAAISIENARLQTETRRTVEELYIINDMSMALSTANNLDALLDVIDMQLPSLTDAEWLYVVLYDANTKQLEFPLVVHVPTDQRHTIEARALGADEFSYIVRQRAPLRLAGEDMAGLRSNLKLETLMEQARCFLGVPLMVGDEVIGVLAVRDDHNPQAFGHNDQRVLTTVGAQLAVAIQSTRLFRQTLELAADLERRVRERTEELERERQHLATLYDITAELATSLDMERLLTRALEMVAKAVGATQGAILAVDPISDRLYPRAQLGEIVWPTDEAGEPLSLGPNEGLAGWAIRSRQSLVVDNVQKDPRWLRLSEADDRPRSALVALIETGEDVLGVMMLYSDEVGQFGEEQLRLTTAAANQVANAMNNAELYTLIRDQAERLSEMLRQEQVEATQSAAILDSVADGVMVVNAQGEVIVFNTAAAQILGVPVEDIRGHSASEIKGVYGSGAQKLEQWRQDPTAYRAGEYHEEQFELDNGRVINVRISPVTMNDQFLGTVSIFRDITREVEVDRLKSEFVATVSHELRTPMTSIKGYADLLLLGAAGDISEAQQRFLTTIKQNADRLSELVNDLLDISRIDQGRVELKTENVLVADVVNAAAAHVRGRSEDEDRPMSVQIELPEDTLTLWGDYDKVTQIITNLADNAFNYTPPGGTITLRAAYDAAHEHVVLSVSDTGVGIPKDIQGRIFERFFRGDEWQEIVVDTPGTGLGLAIVKELVNLHQGQVWFESEAGKGTTFYVSLPAHAPTTDTEPTPPETSEDVVTKSATEPATHEQE